MIQKILDDYFLENPVQTREHRDRLFPTQASAHIDNKTFKRLEGKCIRSAYYNAIGIPEDTTLDTTKRLIFEIGDFTEEMILSLLEKKGALVDKAVKFEIKKYNISGKLDGIIKVDDKDVGLEIKSIGSNKYTVGHIFGTKWNAPFPKWQNLFQTLVYCYAFRDVIDKFILMYIRRDTCEIKEFEISIIPKNGKIYPVIDGKIDERFTINDILDRYKVLYSFIQKDKIPPKEYMPIYPKENIKKYEKLGIISKYQADKYSEEPFGDFECRYCGYAEQCNKEI